ncbi:MAG TPA: TlpA disulfide reductase family protein [Ramlibacter sp.]|nr:TlpA disulfide reductase family protein [Ramlibacter sp.]
MSDSVSEATAPGASPSRRGLLFAGVAGLAALAGGAAALWRRQQSSADAAAAAIWPMTFDTPGGPALAMNTLRGKPLVVNFWATWCPPCIEELPLLDAFYRENSAKGWQVIGLAIDQPSAVRAFLKKTPVSFPVGFAGLGGTELGSALGNLSGGLPFTVVFNAAGGVAQRRMGRVGPADLAQWKALA